MLKTGLAAPGHPLAPWIGKRALTGGAGILSGMAARGSPGPVAKPSRAGRAGQSSAVRTRRGLRSAQAFAFAGLLAALVGAFGPADHLSTTYSWPPPALPSSMPDRVWYTPLLLIRHRPDAISATVPCSAPAALPGAQRPVSVLATARYPERSGGLALTRTGARLFVRIGGDELPRRELRLTSRTAGACAYRLRIADGRWTLEGGPDQLALGGGLDIMPFVSGLFSGLELDSRSGLSISITTAVHRAKTTALQGIAWLVAVLCVVIALLLVAFERRPRLSQTVRSATHAALTKARPADAVVLVVLVGWWVLSPVFWDDGWVIARERTFATSGGFSNYYDSLGGHYPLSYWLEWAEHWLTQATSALLVLRLPALLCLATAWVFCRWIVNRVNASSADPNAGSVWPLASVFLVGALAWGMTLRTEPKTALLVIAVVACTIRFVERESAGPLAGLAILIPLAVTGHHAGVVSIAPILAISPRLIAWARSNLPSASTLFAAFVALVGVLLFVGSDLEQRSADARTISTYGTTGTTWRDELVRYVHLSNFPYGTPIRRAFVALILLAIAAFVLRRRRDKQELLDLPALSLLIALVLLVATPSKWPWHFGALIGLGAVAAATETTRLRQQAASSNRWTLWPFLAVAAASALIAWSWSPRHPWNAVDLRTLEWTLGFERSLPLSSLAIALPPVLVAFAILVARRGHNRPEAAPWRIAASSASVLAMPLIVFTLGVLAADAARTDSWSLTRQNLGSLVGTTGCGLADDLVVPNLRSVRPLRSALPADRTPLPRWVPSGPASGIPRFAIGPAGDEPVRSPWFELPRGLRIGLFVSGTPSLADRLSFEWGRRTGNGFQSLETAEIDGTLASEAGASLPWWFAAASELPRRAPGANVVRVRLTNRSPPGTAIAVTAPVTYSSEKLARTLDGDRAPSLVMPNLLPYFPCARLATLRGGVADTPRHIVVPRNSSSPVRYPATSPFAGVLDLYVLQRLPLADSEVRADELVVFAVDQDIPGGKRVRLTEKVDVSP